MLVNVNRFFPLLALIGAVTAYLMPSWFTELKSAIVPLLVIIMLSMGLTLDLQDFANAFKQKRAVLTGLILQFSVMPLSALLISQLLGLDRELTIGMVLVGSVAGGTASNVVSFIARADVALSVVMTTCSTLAAVFLTPLLTALLASRLVEVDTWGLFLSTFQVVILPVAVGVAFKRIAPGAVDRVLPAAPLVSVLMIALICGSIIGQNASAVREAGPRLLGAILLLHLAGFAVGYLFARALGYPTRTARTISIETGMQNSGLGVVLAQKHFASEPLTAVPGAISALAHSVIGSLLAAWWRREGTPRSDMAGEHTAHTKPK